MSEECMTFPVDYVSNVWHDGSVSYVDVLHVILLPDSADTQ